MIVLPTAYFPNVEYFKLLNSAQQVALEQHEHYPKQTYRNRCEIYTANGKAALSVPVQKVHNAKTAVKDVRISYAENWQKNHRVSIESAYNSSPFYEFFQDYFHHFFEKQCDFLLDLNTEILDTLLEVLELEVSVLPTESYQTQAEQDYRNLSPKQKSDRQFETYPQVFEEKHGFLPNLSILDLLFCLGPEAVLKL